MPEVLDIIWRRCCKEGVCQADEPCARAPHLDFPAASLAPPLDACRPFPQSPAARPVTLVDVPGHPRVRDTWLAWEKSAQGIVFLVDAVDFLPQKSAIAECVRCRGWAGDYRVPFCGGLLLATV